MVEGLRRTLSHIFSSSSPYAPVVEEIRNLSKLDRGWNSHRAGRITDEACGQAIAFVGRLSDLPNVPAPSVVPTPNGGVSLHWLTRNRDVEIIFLSKGGEYSVAERGKDDVIIAGSIGEVDLLKDVVREYVR